MATPLPISSGKAPTRTFILVLQLFSGFSYTFLIGTDLEEDVDAEYLDWAKDNNLDLEVHKSDEVLPE